MKKFANYLNEMARNVIPAPTKKLIMNAITPPQFQQYWDKPGAAITHIAEVLGNYNIEIVETISFNDSLESYRQRYNLTLNGQDVNNMLIFSWYKMPSGKYEITTYIS